MNRFVVVACVALLGCPPPVIDPCARIVTANLEFSELPNFDAVALAGQPVELVFNSPISSCPEDDLRVRIEGTSPDSTTFELQPTAPPARVSADLVQVRASFTPLGPGFFIVRASFEPSLGVRTVYVLAAEVPTRPPPAVEVVSRCREPWAVSADAIACELATGDVELTLGDGGSSSFGGSGLAVVSQVLWSVTREGVLERRELESGALRVTHRFAGFSLEPLRAEQGTDFALRRNSDGRPALISLDGGPVVKDWPNLFLPEAVLLVHPAGVSSFPCGADLCLGGLIASDPSTVWTMDNGHFRSLHRPVMQPAVEGLLRFPNTGPLRPPYGAFERIPFWVPTSQGREVLVSTDLGEPTAIAWERDEVLGVGRQFAVLRALDGGTSARVVRRWR